MLVLDHVRLVAIQAFLELQEHQVQLVQED